MTEVVSEWKFKGELKACNQGETLEMFCIEHRLVYAGKPGERISMIYGTACAIVVHPEHPPKIVRADGSVEVLSISLEVGQ